MGSPLEGIKVVEWAWFANGPLAGVMLGHLGADVLKIEDSTQGGDASRGLLDPDPLPGGRTAFNEVMNWGKRSLALNLKQESARKILFDLIGRADVFLTNNRTSTLERVGLTYENLSKDNPRLIYAAATAYGSRGPAANRAGLDMTSQARAGLMWLGSPEGTIPYVHRGHFGDMGGATLLAYGVVAALFIRELTGLGQKVEDSNFSGALWWEYVPLSLSLLTQSSPRPRDRLNALDPLYNHYQCADGSWIRLCITAPEAWPKFCEAVGLRSLTSDQRFKGIKDRSAHARELIDLLDRHFLTQTRQYWESLFSADRELMCERVNRLEDLKSDPQVLENKYVEEIDHEVLGRVTAQPLPLKFSRSTIVGPRAAPGLGEHSREILRDELHYVSEQFAALTGDGVL